ncbi:hypothetical protein DY000_02061824, partial [Brassica cretica]
ILLLNGTSESLLLCVIYVAEVVAGSAAWLGRGLSCVCAQGSNGDTRLSFDLTPAQEECLLTLQSRIDVAYDSSIPQHQEALRDLWKLAFPEEELHGIVSEQWKEMGWQGKDPSTDFRGGGFISLENLLFFAKNFPKSFQDLLRKQVGDRSVWEYPFAVAGVNITFMLIQMLGLEAVKPRSIVGETFLRFLSVNESAFDLLYCIAFKLMDQQWLSMRASYMEFNVSTGYGNEIDKAAIGERDNGGRHNSLRQQQSIQAKKEEEEVSLSLTTSLLGLLNLSDWLHEIWDIGLLFL